MEREKAALATLITLEEPTQDENDALADTSGTTYAGTIAASSTITSVPAMRATMD